LSKNKGFSGTSASRYSLALYELAKENNSIEEVEKHSLSITKLIFNSDDFRSFIKDPTNRNEDQLSTIIKISEQFKLNNLLTKFL
jgi:F-type H+-transporting ATPase subunit delta